MAKMPDSINWLTNHQDAIERVNSYLSMIFMDSCCIGYPYDSCSLILDVLRIEMLPSLRADEQFINALLNGSLDVSMIFLDEPIFQVIQRTFRH